MDCLACHSANIDGARFCAKCGAPLPTATTPTADPLIGATVGGRYRVVGVLGEGGMGRVYHAEQQMGTSVRKVAVKTLLSQFAKDPQTVARFMREVGTVSELEHPNTIKVYDFGQVEGSGELYIAMELLQGTALEDLLATGQPLPPERVDRIVGQVCGSLLEAHEKGIVHRDLKPANIFLTTRAGEEDVVKVLDFGIAKRDGKDTKQEQKLTQQGTILGTPPYMSPEQFTGRELDNRSDVYSLAIVAYEMLTGKLPFDADTPWEWMTAHMQSQPYPFEANAASASIPPKMKQAVLHALEKDPGKRPATVRDFFEEFTLGATRMSVLGLGTGGAAVASAQNGPATANIPVPSAGAVRPGGTQIGEPLFVAGHAPSGASKTVVGEVLDGAANPSTQAVVPPTMASPNTQGKSGGGPNLALIGAIGFIVLGAVGAGLFYVKGRSTDEDVPTIPIKTTPSATSKSSAAETPSAIPTPDASSTSAASSAGSSSAQSPIEPPATASAVAPAPSTTTPAVAPTSSAASTGAGKTSSSASVATSKDAKIDPSCCKGARSEPTCKALVAGYNSNPANRSARIAGINASTGAKCR